jgi:hypothetical protein
MTRAILSLTLILGLGWCAEARAQGAAGLVGGLNGHAAGNGASVHVNDPGLPLPAVSGIHGGALSNAQPITIVADPPKPKPQPDPALGGLKKVHDAMPLTATEIEIVARIVKGEVWPTSSFEAHVAVAAVVLNRVRSKGFPGTVAGVAHAPFQFSCYNADKRAKLYWGPIPDVALRAARAAAAGADPVKGATFYFNPYLVSPSWADSMTFLRRIGVGPNDTHDFYK